MEQSQQSRFITYLALFSIIASVIMIIQGISNLSTLNSIKSRPEYKIAEQLLPSLTQSPLETMVELFLQFSGIIASIGLLKRKDWGRIMYIAILSVLTVWGIFSSITSYLSLSQYLNAFGMGGSVSLLIIGNAIALGINIFLVWKLSTNEIRKEFNSQYDAERYKEKL